MLGSAIWHVVSELAGKLGVCLLGSQSMDTVFDMAYED